MAAGDGRGVSGAGHIFVVSKAWQSAPALREAAPLNPADEQAIANGADLGAALITVAKIFLGSAPADHWPLSMAPQHLVNGAHAVGLAPMLYRSPAFEQLPLPVKEACKRAYLRNAAHSVRLVEALHHVCTALTQAGIEAVPFKGVVLSQMLYGAGDFRQSVDIDLMIRRVDVMRALPVLHKCGYQGFIGEAETAKVVRRAFSFEMRNPHNGVLLDVQWDIANGYCKSAFAESELFQRTTPIKLAPYVFPTFNPVVTLYLLCVHGAKNSWCELKTLLDLAMMLKKGDPAVLAEVVSLMHNQGTLTMLQVGALLVSNLLGMDVPPLLEKKRNHSVQVLADEISTFWQGRIQPSERPPAFQRFKWDLCFREGMRERTRYFLFRMRPTKRDYVDQKGSMHWAWGARLLRVIRTKQQMFR